jgi:hypothetical protein
METKEKIENRIAELLKEKETWDNQCKDIESGKIPMLPPYADMVTRHIAMYGYQIESLNWVLQNAL